MKETRVDVALVGGYYPLRAMATMAFVGAVATIVGVLATIVGVLALVH